MDKITSAPNPNDPLSAILERFRKLRPSKVLALTLLTAALTSAVATWIVITGSDTPFDMESGTLTALVAVNLVLVLVLATLIFRRMLELWRAMKRGAVGSRLQTRIVLIFSLVTIIPTIVVSVFSAIFFHVGIKGWFDERVRIAIEESVAVAESYLAEHKETIRADAQAMVLDIERDQPVIFTNPGVFSQILSSQAALRNLTEAIVFDHTRVIARTQLSFSLAFERLPPQVLARADEGKVVVLADDEDKIRALVRLRGMEPVYLLVGRLIDPKVLNHMVVAQGGAKDYRALKENISSIQLHFSLLFALVAVLLLLAAIWYGMYLALRLVVPITRLIHAAEQVRAGDFAAQVPDSGKQDEIAILGRAFNRMTQQLEKQRQDLITVNRQLDERRRFIEAVFAGVSAGVVALNGERIITLNNRTAAYLLQDDDSQSMKGMPIIALLPDIALLLKEVTERPDSLAEQHMTVKRMGKLLNLQVRVAVETKGDEVEGFIVTFDDITELVSAQRNAAWADVARRIAHEIKNPLTPITLSAERLKKKFMGTLSSEEDQEAFRRYTDTIARHVKDIGQMVEEFASFARMPVPVFASHNLNKIVRDALFSAQTAHRDTRFYSELPDQPALIRCDERQIAQTLTNLLKNAAEGVEAKQEQITGYKGEVKVSITQQGDEVRLVIEDNGIGFPPDKIHMLTEPYVTTRAKGTGLGLAIVRKHMEDHKGSLVLENRPSGGAQVTLSFPQD